MAPATATVRRLTASIGSEALSQARLRLLPRPSTQAARLPFVLFVTVILLSGVVGLLLFNTELQQAAFHERQLRQQATELAAKAEAMQIHLSDLAEPDAVARQAQAQGMVIPVAPAVLNVASAAVEGSPVAADDRHTPTLTTVYDPAHTWVFLPGAATTDQASTPVQQ